MPILLVDYLGRREPNGPLNYTDGNDWWKFMSEAAML